MGFGELGQLQLVFIESRLEFETGYQDPGKLLKIDHSKNRMFTNYQISNISLKNSI